MTARHIYLSAAVLLAVSWLSAASADPPAAETDTESAESVIAEPPAEQLEDIKAYFDREVELRQSRMDTLRVELPALKQAVYEANRQDFSNREQKRRAVDAARQKWQDAAAEYEQLERGAFPKPSLARRPVLGQIGYYIDDASDGGEGFRVFQVIDERNCLVQYQFVNHYADGHMEWRKTDPMWFKNVSTDKFSDGDLIGAGNTAYYVSGTTTYETANGTSTVKVVEPFDIEVYRPWYNDINKAAPNGAAR